MFLFQADIGGRITVFQASLANIGPGALTSREDPNLRAAKVSFMAFIAHHLLYLVSVLGNCTFGACFGFLQEALVGSMFAPSGHGFILAQYNIRRCGNLV